MWVIRARRTDIAGHDWYVTARQSLTRDPNEARRFKAEAQAQAAATALVGKAYAFEVVPWKDIEPV